jgi:hypothetical protein
MKRKLLQICELLGANVPETTGIEDILNIISARITGLKSENEVLKAR